MAGNPVALAAGTATLRELKKGDAYRTIEALGAALDAAAAARGVRVARVGGIFWPYLDPDGPVPTTAEAITARAVDAYRSRYHGWLGRGIYLPPSAYEVGFLSGAHELEHVEELVAALAG